MLVEIPAIIFLTKKTGAHTSPLLPSNGHSIRSDLVAPGTCVLIFGSCGAILGLLQESGGGFDALKAALLAQHIHGLEQRRRGSTTCDGDT